MSFAVRHHLSRAARFAAPALVAALLISTPAWAMAAPQQLKKSSAVAGRHGGGPGPSGGPTHSAPEIDPSLAGGALVLLIGGVLLLTDRRQPVRS
jgi:hypothetical protein